MSFPAFIVPPVLAGEITFVGSAVGNDNTGSGATVTLSSIAGLAEDDIVVVFFFTSDVSQILTPSGWTAIDTLESTYASAAFYKIQTATPDTFVAAGEGGVTCGVAFAFRGVSLSTPLDVAATTFARAGTFTPDPPSITPTNNNCAIIAFGGNDISDASVGTITDYTSPSPSNTAADNGEIFLTTAGAYRILSGGAGVGQNPGTWSAWTNATSISHAFTIALRPA